MSEFGAEYFDYDDEEDHRAIQEHIAKEIDKDIGTYKDKVVEEESIIRTFKKWIRKNWEFKVASFVIIYYLISHVLLESTDYVWETGLDKHLRVIPNEVIQYYDENRQFDQKDFNVDKFAYVQYATNYEYLNLAIINFIHLQNSGSKIKNYVILYDKTMTFHNARNWNELYLLSNKHNIDLRPVDLLKTRNSESSSWSSSFTKFHIFNLIEFDRIVYFDADSMLLNIPNESNEEIDFNTLVNSHGNIDELFKLPKEIKYALPQAYWLNDVVEQRGKVHDLARKLPKKVEIPTTRRYHLRMGKLVNDISKLPADKSSFNLLPTLLYEGHKYDNFDDFFANHIMVIKPSRDMFHELLKYTFNPWYWSIFNRSMLKRANDYDMEILNKVFNDKFKAGEKNFKVGILPHKVYGVLTGEFREFWHRRFTVEPQYLPFIKKEVPDKEAEWKPIEILQGAKVVHFSDSPIPKPWEHQDNEDYYNSNKIYCAQVDDWEDYYITYPGRYKPRITEDCASVDIWNWIRHDFSKSRLSYWVIK
ncbi:alphaN-acetylglucosamine transferase [Scheffersomyces amazonensis]|uniref:alphaN-acetylglucosamine transferase n=1 Tax=Scheffersomyces amazonensis TaxID=1078765 RepID=UPI00315CCF97